MFFFEKKNQKTFFLVGGTPGALHRARGGDGSKSFLLLFFKKEVLSSFL